MEILADTHAHIYPVHDPAALIGGAAGRLRRAAKTADPIPALLLAEGRGHNYFDRLRDGSHGLPGNFQVEPPVEGGAVRVSRGGGESVWIFAGRQIAAGEGVEILALTLAGGVGDGLPAEAAVAEVLARGGVPVLAWAPGKWSFRRAAVVGRLLDTFGPGQLLLGDSSLRPLGWPEPAPMRDPDRRVLAGSDPLPLPGEEARAGGYGIRLSGEFDRGRPVTSIRRLLTDTSVPVGRIGRRDPPWRAAFRLVRHRLRKGGAR